MLKTNVFSLCFSAGILLHYFNISKGNLVSFFPHNFYILFVAEHVLEAGLFHQFELHYLFQLNHSSLFNMF